MLTFDSVSKDLVAAGTSADPDHPQDVVRVQPAGSRARSTKLTDVNGDVLQGKQLAKVEEITYTSTGNAKVQGWIVKPPSFDASKKYPLILEIHGGPFAQLQRRRSTTCSRTSPRTASSCSYTNPRGSTGYGSEFINGIDHNYPGARLRRPDGRRRRRRRQGLRRHVADVRVGLQRRRRAFELGDRPHRSLRRGGGALPGDRLAEHGRPDRHPALHLQLLQEAVLGGSVGLARALVADVRSAR